MIFQVGFLSVYLHLTSPLLFVIMIAGVIHLPSAQMIQETESANSSQTKENAHMQRASGQNLSSEARLRPTMHRSSFPLLENSTQHALDTSCLQYTMSATQHALNLLCTAPPEIIPGVITPPCIQPTCIVLCITFTQCSHVQKHEGTT